MNWNIIKMQIYVSTYYNMWFLYMQLIFYYDLRYSNTSVNICMYRQVYVIGTYVTTNNIEAIILYYLLCKYKYLCMYTIYYNF